MSSDSSVTSACEIVVLKCSIKTPYFKEVGEYLETCYVRDSFMNKSCLSPKTQRYNNLSGDAVKPSDVKAMIFLKQIHFLFNGIGAKFPNLLMLTAWMADLKSVEQENFQNLTKLKVLNLRSNDITTISDYTFKHLASLEYLDLSANKIINVRPEVFFGLSNLKSVRLDGDIVSLINRLNEVKKENASLSEKLVNYHIYTHNTKVDHCNEIIVRNCVIVVLSILLIALFTILASDSDEVVNRCPPAENIFCLRNHA
jgi:Leucine-rich repeat (LRR) protein